MLKKLKDIKESDKERVGKKAYNCAMLVKNGILAPNGFVIFEGFDDKDIQEINNIVKDDCLYAVRSSAIDEDNEKCSNAGKYKTTIPVRRDHLVQSIKSFCQIYKGNETVSILVQELIKAECSGVLFTRNPISGDDCRVINSCFGACENVVSGIIEVDTFEIYQDHINTVIAPKIATLSYGFDSYPGEKNVLNGCEVRTVISNNFKSLHSFDYSNKYFPSLEQNQIIELDNISKVLKEMFETDIDMEFCYQQGRLYILQVRPITSLEWIEKEKQPIISTGQRIIRGQTASKGHSIGCTHFIDIYEKELVIEKLEKLEGKILVTYEIMPELLYALKDIKGIITAKGGILSHGAILAREKNIPCIVGVGEEIKSLNTGTIVEIEANQGIIIIKEMGNNDR